MQNVSVKFTKLNPDAIVPSYGTQYSAGADLYACEGKDVTILPHQTVFVHTGIAIELPDGTVGVICARSGLASKRSLAPANKVGIIDCDYRGELIVALHNHSNEPQTILDKERVAQLLILPCFVANFVEADSLEESVRGKDGFGSTGRL